MPSTIEQVFFAADCDPRVTVAWGEPIPLSTAGIYAVSLTDRVDLLHGALDEAPISLELVEDWLTSQPELKLDGVRPSAVQLSQRLTEFWLADEVILYVGLAGTSVGARVRQYYSTPLGARSPHAGGHWIKTLANLDGLYVHCASVADPSTAERTMIDKFCDRVDDSTREQLHDPSHPLPFANLAWPGRGRKLHGITGSKAARQGDDRPIPIKASQSPQSVTTADRQPTLHAELLRILADKGNTWMTTQALAKAVNPRGQVSQER